MNNIDDKIPSVQKALNRLIAEEFIAGMFYKGCIQASIEMTFNEAVFKLFNEIAIDEIDDHMKHLKNWALMNGYNVPFKPKDYEKYAEKIFKQLNNLKANKNINYYIDEAIQSEIDAINSYEEIMKDNNIPYDLYTIMQQNMYDELDHLEDLKFMKYAFDAEAHINADTI